LRWLASLVNPPICLKATGATFGSAIITVGQSWLLLAGKIKSLSLSRAGAAAYWKIFLTAAVISMAAVRARDKTTERFRRMEDCEEEYYQEKRQRFAKGGARL